MKEVLEARLEELGITKYEVAKRVAEFRGKQTGDVTSSVDNVLSSPDRRRFDNLNQRGHLNQNLRLRSKPFQHKAFRGANFL